MKENLVAKFPGNVHHARVAAHEAIHLKPKSSRLARAMCSAADPILAMASAPFAPVQPTVAKAKRRRRK